MASLLIAELFDKSKDGERSECLLLEKDYMNDEAGPELCAVQPQQWMRRL